MKYLPAAIGRFSSRSNTRSHQQYIKALYGLSPLIFRSDKMKILENLLFNYPKLFDASQ